MTLALPRPTLRITAAALLGLAAAVGTAFSQAATPAPAPKLEFPAASPAATLKLRVGVTDIEIDYSRPSMRGRTIFGGLVPYDQRWRTGANSATRISFSTPVSLNGNPVPAGTYELFSIPGRQEWTIIVHKNMSQWGDYQYDAANDVLRFKAKPTTMATPTETFAIGLSELRDASATLYLAWETTRVPIKLEVDTVGILKPRIEAAMAAPGGKKPYAQAAMFYYENNIELPTALRWMNAALAENPKAFWLTYRKGLILNKMGDKKGALEAARQSLAMASEAKGSMKDEYVRLNEALIANLN